MVAKYKFEEIRALAKSPLGFEQRTIIYYCPHQPQSRKHVIVICFHSYKKQHYHSNYEKGWGTLEDFLTSAFVFEFLGEVVMNIELMQQIQDHSKNGESTYHYMECI